MNKREAINIKNEFKRTIIVYQSYCYRNSQYMYVRFVYDG